jgi:NTE family protein
MTRKTADLVLEGGGVKGIGLVGTLAALAEDGYTFNRVSGTSAGAVIGALVAAGLAGEKLRSTAMSLDYRKFRDPAPLEQIPVVGPALASLRGDGLFRGDYARNWLLTSLAELGVRTFADLRIDDPDLPPQRRYKLVVTVSDVTNGRLVRLPWDYREVYGLDPDEQLVADAVRASMSIPFFFEPVTLRNPITKRSSTLVDGGLLSNFPIDSLDRTDGKTPRWPTFGVKLLPNLPADRQLFPPTAIPMPTIGPLQLLEDIVTTAVVGHDQTAMDLPWVAARTITVDTESVGVVDFGVGAEQQTVLFDNGHAAGRAFLRTWDWQRYLQQFRVPVDAGAATPRTNQRGWPKTGSGRDTEAPSRTPQTTPRRTRTRPAPTSVASA